MKRTQFGKREWALVVCASLLTLVISDLVLKRILPPVYRATRYGWSVVPNRTEEKRVQDSPGNFRTITIRHFQHGFKRWGDVHTAKTKMLIIGDSVTHMRLVSNGEEWYSYLERASGDLELFVFGGGGYGSLQEFMVLDDFMDEIRPDVILIQFCSNDYENNVYDLDVRGYPYNNHGVRPYWEDDRIVFRLPLPWEGVRRQSFLADRVLAIYDRIVLNRAANNPGDYLKKKSVREKAMAPAQKQQLAYLREKSVAVTRTIYHMIRERTEGIPVHVFNFSDDPVVEEICRENQFECISGIDHVLAVHENAGMCLRVPNDGHWNVLGNRIVGEQMVAYFQDRIR